MPPFTTHCTFNGGGDLTLALESNPHLPGKVIAVLRNDHKGWMHAVRVLERNPQQPLPQGHCGPLSTLPEQVPDTDLLDGLNQLLGDCASLLPHGNVRARDLIEQPDPSQFTVQIAPSKERCRVVRICDADGREAAVTFVNVPESWTDKPCEFPLSTADPAIQEAAQHALLSSQARTHRARANADTYQQTFGRLAALFPDSDTIPTAEWILSNDDCGIELLLTTPDPKDSWRLLRLLEEWLGQYSMPDVDVTLDEVRRSVSALLRGTAPVHFVAWYRARH
jgi:hypothetical protein